MIFHRLRLIYKNQMGFTLMELIVAIAIAGVIIGGITMTIFQVIDGNAHTTNHMTAIRQVQSAGYWVSHDVQMAQIVDTSGSAGFPLTLSWSAWDSDDEYTAIYTLEDNKLKRSYSFTGQPTETSVLAQYIDPTGTSCQFADGKLTLTVTATVGTGSQQQSETRIYEVIPRPNPQ